MTGTRYGPSETARAKTLSFFAQTEAGVLAQASDGLEHRFGPRAGAPDCTKIVPSIRHVQLPVLIEDRRVKYHP